MTTTSAARTWPKRSIDDDAALGALRRRERQKLLKIDDGGRGPEALAKAGLAPTLQDAMRASGEHVPATLPSWDAKKAVWTITMSPRLLALIAAIAEQEGVSQALMLAMLLWQKVQSPPEDPAKVRRDYVEMMRQTVLLEREANRSRGID